jgi:hypothetical protein
LERDPDWPGRQRTQGCGGLMFDALRFRPREPTDHTGRDLARIVRPGDLVEVVLNPDRHAMGICVRVHAPDGDGGRRSFLLLDPESGTILDLAWSMVRTGRILSRFDRAVG